MDGFFIHREPILDQNKCVAAYELIFRKNVERESVPKWPSLLLDGDSIDAVSKQVDIEKLTGGRPGFLNMNPTALYLNAVTSLPKKSVIQVSEKDGPDKDVLLGCALLKKNGYSIAIDYSLGGPGLLSIHQVADYVKVDVSSFTDSQLAATVALFKRFPALKLFAVNVDERDTYSAAKEAGFHYFRGPFFLRGSSSSSDESISSSQTVLMQLSGYLKDGREMDAIEKTFRSSPKLTYGLLKLMNSAFFGMSNKVSSIRHAIALLGYDNLQKWVLMLLFAVDHRDSGANPLIEKAAVRGRTMETLAKKAGRGDFAEGAFITGMLSYIHVLLGVSPEEALKNLGITNEIKAALLSREGFLGSLLRLVERLDRQDYEGVEQNLDNMSFTVSDMLNAETDAVIDSQSVFAWGNAFAAPNGAAA